MTYLGASGQTKAEIASTLHLSDNDPSLATGLERLSFELAQQRFSAELHLAHRLWIKHDYPISTEYTTKVARCLRASPHHVSFDDVELARRTINQWASDQTNGLIENLIPAGSLNRVDRMVITSAIYFKANWQNQFNEAQTQDRAFYAYGTDRVDVPTMRRVSSFAYAECDWLRIISLPYHANASMLILFPQQNSSVERLEEELSQQALERWIAALQRQSVELDLPRFRIDGTRLLSATLQELGIKEAFSRSADFSAMTDGPTERGFRVGEAIHSAKIAVDENGTEAAAATAIIMRGGYARPADPIEMHIDRPFVYLIRDDRTGLVLFLGRVTNPEW